LVNRELVTKAEYARRHGVSKVAAQKWEDKGWLVMVSEGDRSKVDVAASDANLAKYRDTADGRAASSAKKSKPNGKPAGKPSAVVNQGPPVAPPQPKQLVALPKSLTESAQPEESPAEAADRIIASFGADMTTEEARRVKENYLALQGKLTYERDSGLLIELSEAERVMFDAARAARDAWLNWPAKAGPLIAADLGLDADKVTEVLTVHAYKQVERLGIPEFDLGENA